jgi:23S rRNA pseudouridine2605 synthase
MSVGRLDFDSEGLLLLTNDGMLARRLELPETGWIRRYRVRVYGTPGQTEIRRLADGIEINTFQYGSIVTTVDSTKGSNSWLSISLREGKNQELRKIFEYLGFPINRLIRIAYGPFQLGKLEKGGVSQIGRGILKEQLGIKFDDAHRRRKA